VLGFDVFLDGLPVLAVRRIGEHVVEALVGEAVLGKRVAEDDLGGVLALEQHVGAAHGVGLGLQLLAE